MDNYTCYTNRGHSVVDYICTGYGMLEYVHDFKVVPVSEAIAQFDICPIQMKKQPDHAILVCGVDLSEYNRLSVGNTGTVQITFIFIGQTRLVFGKCVCTCVTKHSNAFRTFLNWLKNSKRVWHEPKLHISRLPLFANFDL